jgi:hypothetical protein
MRLRPLPDTFRMECGKKIIETLRRGYLMYFCHECLQIEPVKEEKQHEQCKT